MVSRKKALSRLQGVLEIVSLEMMLKSHGQMPFLLPN